ncbi:DUF3131 domain-containing protein [Noviherbaspirillum humi]|uniref:DUF3131 domain-containing protein n=1 Tax=Noviherbaspirillum humi TaxID=1688639 RepID=UPI0015958F5F|nr:DUF3131 domain-containing protein [Noviherbaspirillum humi]
MKRLLTVFVLGLSLAAAGCGVVARGVANVADHARHAGGIGRAGKLTDKETAWAKAAWRYFEANTHPQTGLTGGTDRALTLTMWQLGDTLAATVAAYELELIEQREFDTRIAKILNFLYKMPLSYGAVPAKVYNIESGAMVNFGNQPEDIGWSATDIGRLMMWMKITGERYPRFREYFDKVVFRWNFCKVIDDCGTMFGASRSQGQSTEYQEGRLGYEQLTSAGYAVWGFDTKHSASLEGMEAFNIFGRRIYYDARDPRLTKAQAPVATMPYALMGMEFGWRYPSRLAMSEAGGIDLRKLANDVYQVQEERYRRENVFTARTDYQIKEAPYQVLDSVFAAGYPFNTIGNDGKEYPDLALVSTKAAFAMWAVWPTGYTDELIKVVQSLYDPERGWYEGRLEKSGAIQENITLSTNAAVLESLMFKAWGQLYPGDATPGYFQAQQQDAFAPPNRCYPIERPICDAKLPNTRLGKRQTLSGQ